MAGTGMNRSVMADGTVQELVKARDGAQSGIWSDDQLITSRRAFIPDEGLGDDLLVFGYGSLIWNPSLDYDGRIAAKLYGYHRRFCLWSEIGRGAPGTPGLVLALDYGGSVKGVCFKIPAAKAVAEADLLWRREMLNGSYTPKWVRVHTDTGISQALTFVIRRDKPVYAPPMTAEKTADVIAKASGFVGPCADYLFSTAEALAAENIHDPSIRLLVKLVKERQAT